MTLPPTSDPKLLDNGNIVASSSPLLSSLPLVEKMMDMDTAVEEEKEQTSAASETLDSSSFSKKIKIAGLNKYASNKDIKKFLVNSLDIGAPDDLNIKKNPKWDYAFVTFRNETGKVLDLKVVKDRLESSLFKNKFKPEVSIITMEQEEQQQRIRNEGWKKDRERKTVLEKSVADCVAPMREIPYQEQLEKKRKIIENVINTRFYRELQGKTEKKPVLPTLPSPIEKEYRNKNEFTIGFDTEMNITVGYKKGSYDLVKNAIEFPENCEFVTPLAHLEICSRFQAFLRDEHGGKALGLPCSGDGANRTGLWRILRIRSVEDGSTMVGIQIHPNPLQNDPTLYEKIKTSVINLFKDFSFESNVNGRSVTFKITHILIQQSDQLSTVMDHSRNFDLIYGASPCIREQLLGLCFDISIESFFQVNTPAAAVLYSTVKDLLFPSQSSNGEPLSGKKVLLDLCSGTGTIGQIMADKFDKVIGIEIVPEAVEDASKNAKLNGIENAVFVCGKVEEQLSKVLGGLDESEGNEVIAILDPPRSGCPKSVICAIRARKDINRVIYVSCSPEQACANFVQLCRQESRTFTGTPFKMTHIQPVDLFPHTKHCELVLVFERTQDVAEQVPEKENLNGEQQ